MAQKEYNKLRRLTATGDLMMTIGLVMSVFIATALLQFDTEISIGVKVLGHIAVIMLATSVKIGYLLRCIGQYEQGEDNY